MSHEIKAQHFNDSLISNFKNYIIICISLKLFNNIYYMIILLVDIVMLTRLPNTLYLSSDLYYEKWMKKLLLY